MPDDVTQRLRAAIDAAATGLVARRPVVELLLLGAVARQHVLLLGPPGTAKSEMARRFAAAIDARRFEYLMGRFTEPNELFGPLDLVRLREGEVVTRTEGMLPEAEIAFLDEIFLGSTAVLNTLLGLLADRTFLRGHQRMRVPLRLCVAASNARPDRPELAAFADRFAVTAHVEPVPDARLEDLLEAATALRPVEPVATLADVDTLAERAAHVDLTAVRAPYAAIVRALRTEGIGLSDRRVVQGQRLIAAAAALAGRTQASGADLWPVVALVPGAEDQDRAREVLAPHLAASDNPTLPGAAEAHSASAPARARRILDQGRALLAAPRDGTDRWRWRLEGVGREIDAHFAEDDRPEDLSDLRARIVAALA